MSQVSIFPSYGGGESVAVSEIARSTCHSNSSHDCEKGMALAHKSYRPENKEGGDSVPPAHFFDFLLNGYGIKVTP